MPSMASKTSSERRLAAPQTTAAHPRVRRGNVEDQQAFRQTVLETARNLFQSGGVDAVTMRGVASQVGVSAMALYRYFPSKAGLLRGLWEATITELTQHLQSALNRPGLSARQRLRASIDAYLNYYETRPDCYRLMFMTSQTHSGAVEEKWTDTAIYRDVLRTSKRLTEEVAQEIGGDMNKVRLASDLRYAMATGYLHCKLTVERYPWTDMAALRRMAIEQIAVAVENCLLNVPAAEEGVR